MQHNPYYAIHYSIKFYEFYIFVNSLYLIMVLIEIHLNSTILDEIFSISIANNLNTFLKFRTYNRFIVDKHAKIELYNPIRIL